MNIKNVKNFFKTLIPKLWARVTKTHRQKVEIIWSDKSWVHNIFRFYELVCWRKFGVRPEASTRTWHDDKGKMHVIREFYTIEALLAYCETLVREYLSIKSIKRVIRFFDWRDWGFEVEYITAPRLQATNGMQFDFNPKLPIFSLAVAFDASSSKGGTSATTETVNHVCTGTHLVLWSMGGSETNTISSNTGVTYNGVAFANYTQDQRPNGDGSNADWGSIWYLVNPATGTNSLVSTWNGSSAFKEVISVSYSGCDTSNPIGATTNNSGFSTNVTATVNTLYADSYVITFGLASGSAPSSSQTARGRALDICVSDQIATSIGGYSVNATSGGNTNMSVWGIEQVAFGARGPAPAVSDTTTMSDTPTIRLINVINVSDTTAVTDTVHVIEANYIFTVSDTTAVTDSVSMHVVLKMPVVSFRMAVSPYSFLPEIDYQQSTPYGNVLPVLGGNDSDKTRFRIYNNFSLTGGMTDVINLTITTYDGPTPNHTAVKPVVNQLWTHFVQTGFGQGSTTPGSLYRYAGTDGAVGGSIVYIPDIGSDGVAGSAKIKAGSDGNGCGFIELDSYTRVPVGATAGEVDFDISVLFNWTP